MEESFLYESFCVYIGRCWQRRRNRNPKTLNTDHSPKSFKNYQNSSLVINIEADRPNSPVLKTRSAGGHSFANIDFDWHVC